MNGQTMRRLASWAAGAAVIGVAAALVAAWTALAFGSEPAWRGDPARSNEGAVQFVLTPRDVSGGHFRVDIAVTTHSGNLAELHLQATTELRADGRSLRPVKATALRGHHARGRLEFALERVPDEFEIVIAGVRTMGPLTFRWP